MMKFRVASHTDNLAVGSTYVAIVGETSNGLSFIPRAVEKGANKIVVEHGCQLEVSVLDLCKKNNIAIEYVPDARIALAALSAHAYGHPASSLKIIGVTGTDGKTTSVYLLYSILKQAGKKVALLSGVENIRGSYREPAALTTPKPDFIHYFLDQCVKDGIEYVVVEVSAQATTLHRIDGISFDGLIFTNLAREHGECYPTMEDYFAAKCAILNQNKKGAPLIVPYAHQYRERLENRFADISFTKVSADSEYTVSIAQETAWKQLLDICVEGQRFFLETHLIGSYNASNIINVIALAKRLGVMVEDSIHAIEEFEGVSGRLERFKLLCGADVIVDYAHTPQAFEALLSRLDKYTKNLTVIFGASGGKDQAKRPLMGAVSTLYAQTVVLTNDNPRHEDPEEIMAAIVADLSLAELARVKKIPDRAEAIKYVCNHARSGDIIVILGKGAETVQIVGTQRILHSDTAVVQQLMHE